MKRVGQTALQKDRIYGFRLFLTCKIYSHRKNIFKLPRNGELPSAKSGGRRLVENYSQISKGLLRKECRAISPKIN